MPAKRPPQSKAAYPRPAPFLLPLRGRGKHEVPEPAPALDTVMMPHILDRIVELAPHATLIALRAVNRDLRERVDARLAEHLVLRSSRSPFNSGAAYIHARGHPSSPEPHALVGADIALPGFAFFPDNELKAFSAIVQERERKLASMPTRRYEAPSLPALLLHREKEAAERERVRRKGYTARAAEWCEAALKHTRVVDVPIGSVHLLPRLAEQMPNLEVARISSCSSRGLSLAQSLRHVIVSVDTWAHGVIGSLSLPKPVRTMTIFVNIIKEWPGHPADIHFMPQGLINTYVRDVTVVIRIIRSALYPTAPSYSEVPSVAEGVSSLLKFFGDGGRYTFVNATYETRHAFGLEPRRPEGGEGGEGPEGRLDAWFMPAFEDLVRTALHYKPDLDAQVELLHRSVRVLSMEEWKTEASTDDLEALRDFW